VHFETIVREVAEGIFVKFFFLEESRVLLLLGRSPRFVFDCE
jgi:hypothetical protein